MHLFCVWDVPNVESFLPLLRQMTALGWSNEVIPVQKAPDAIRNIEKTLTKIARK
jgi:hypothetical protein